MLIRSAVQARNLVIKITNKQKSDFRNYG